jgi:SAM-dependent methyltransferase
MRVTKDLPSGNALDLACGAGRNALWLASFGWKVTAVDGSIAALDILHRRATERRLEVDARVADLEKGEFKIKPSCWDLIAICYYLQLDLIESAKQGLKPGGLLVVIVHVAEPGEAPTKHRLRPGELGRHFEGWEVLHSFEGQPEDRAHRRAVAEIVAKRPLVF